jgi:RHS repeat-associated protein
MKLGKLVVVLGIIASAVISFGQTAPNLLNGVPPLGSYDSSNIDTINLMNGNLTLHIPLPISTPQRGKLGIKYYLVVNAKTWKAVPGIPGFTSGNQWTPTSVCTTAPPTPSGPCGQGPVFVSTASFAMTRGYQAVSTDGQDTQYSVGDPSLATWDGAGHDLLGTSTAGVYQSIDTSGYRVQVSGSNFNGLPYNAVIIDSDGTQYSGGFSHDNSTCSTDPGNGLPGSTRTTTCSEHFVLGSVTDANGNVLSAPLGVPDIARPNTNGPAVVTHLAASSETAGCLSSFGTPWVAYLDYPAANGQTNQIKLCFGTYPQLATSFSPAGIHQFQDSYSGRSFPGNYRQPVYLTNVILPDNTQWALNYDSYGEITSVTNPAGGSIQYAWAEGQFPVTSQYDITSVSRAVHTRTLQDVNGNSFTWTYQWGGQASDGTMTNTVTDSQRNDTTHVFTSIEANQTLYPYNFKETGTVSYQGSGGSRTALQRIDTTWLIKLDGGMGVPTDRKTTLLPSQKVSLIHTDYDPSSPTLGLVTGRKTYDWGTSSPGPLLQEVDTVYQWQSDSRFLAANILDSPASVVIKDGAGQKMAETDYAYDEAAYLTPYESTIGALPAGTHVGAPNAVRGNLTTVSRWLNPSNSMISTHVNWYDTGEMYKSIDPLGNTTTHSYSLTYAGALPTQTCNAKNHCVSGTYDGNTGLLTSFTDANSQTSNYSYDLMSRITSALAPADPGNGGARAQTTFTYSTPNGFPMSVQRQQSITPGVMDSTTTYFDGLGHSFRTQHATPGGTVTVNTAYDGSGHVATVTNPFYSTSDSTYGTIQSQYDALGRVTQVTKQDGSISTVAYTDNCSTSIDEASKKRRSCSDGLGRLTEVDEPNPGAAATDATGVVTVSGMEQSANSQADAAGSGRVTISGTEQSVPSCFNDRCFNDWDTGTVTVTVNGFSKSVSYGQADTSSTLASNLAVAFNGDGSSPVNASAAGTVVTLTAKSTGSTTNYSLSSSSVTNDSGTFGGPSFTPSNGSSLTGGQNASSTPDTGTVTATINGTSYTVGYGAGDTSSSIATRLATAIGAGAYANSSASGGTVNLTSKTAGTSGNYSLAASYTYNSGQFSQPSFTTVVSGTGLTGGYNASDLTNNPYVTLYTYDTLGNLLTVNQKGATSDPTQWRTRTFTYDSFSRLLTANNPESGTVSYFYDPDGNLLQKVSPSPNQTGTAQHTISYCYDVLNRVNGKAYSWQNCQNGQLPQGTAVVSYVYDQGTNGIGKLSTLTDQAGSGTYNYDVLGRLSSESRTIAGVTKNLSYTYNLDGSVARLTYPSGATIKYAPDSAGRVLSAVDTGNNINYVTGATYGPDNSLTGFVSGNSGTFAGISNSFSFNNRLQPMSMSAASPSVTVFNINYDFHVGNGDNGNVWGITNNKDITRNQSFTYDALNRLTSAQNAGTDCSVTLLGGTTKFWGNSYSYDAWGNLLSKSVTKCSAENLVLTATANNQLLGYSYDAAGNMTHDLTTGNNYTYDQENRITGAAGFTYTYDADGNRVEKANGTTGTLYWYMTPGIIGESDLAGNLKSEYVFFDGERVARKDFPGNTVSYYFSDHLKTASVITDSAGNIKSESDYYSWGGELQFANNDSNHYKFTGKERDSESGLDNFGKRYDSSSIGRFMTPDAFYKDSHVGDPQSWNEYAYARNNPLRYVDPTGENATVSTSCTTTNNQTTCNVNISASISIYAAPGSNLTQQQLNQAAGTIQNSIQNAWTGSFTQDGVAYNVTTQVSVSVANSQDAAMHSGAQNVIGMTNGPPQAGVGAYVNPKSLWGAITGKPDTGMMDINDAANYSKHEFTHLLGVDDKGGTVLSNTNPAMRPNSATSQDYGWGIREATQGVNRWVNTPEVQYRNMRYGEMFEVRKPSAYSDTTTVGAPAFWWK